MHHDILEALQSPDAPTEWRAGAHGGIRTVSSIRERLFANTLRDQETGCLIRQYATHRRYPIIHIRNRAVQASRVVFYLEHGYEPVVVRHTCDRPLCVEPSHLTGGTYKDNTRDAIERGRLHTGPRVSHCLNGHPNTPENRYASDGGCRPCALNRSRNRKEAKK